MEEADLLLDMMEYEAAIVNYLKVLSQDPQQRDVRKKIGYAYFRLEKTDDAISYLKEELTLFPDNCDAYDLLVYILYKLDKLHEANNFLESLDFPVRLTEGNPHIGGLGCFILGMYFKEVKEYERAEKFFRRAIEKEHDKVKCFVQLIDMDLIRGKLDLAISFFTISHQDILQEAREACGLQPEFYFMYGLRYLEKSKSDVSFFRNSIRYFEEALKLNPYFKDALFNLACISYNYNDFEKASEYFRDILWMEPENSEIKFYLDCCLEKFNKPVKDESSSECPQTIMFSKEFIDNPDREYKTQSKYDENFVLENINHLGLEFIRRGKLSEAIKRFQNCLKIYPESPEVNFNLGMVYFWQNNFQEAERHALIALKKRGFFGQLPAHIRQKIFQKEGDSLYKPLHIPLSEWTFDVALRRGNYFLEGYDLLGNIYFKRGEFKKSFTAYKKVIDIDPEDALGHYNLGCVYYALNDRENAENEWKKAINVEKESEKMKDRRDISEDQLKISLVVIKRRASFHSHKSLGYLYLDKNLPDKALKEFQKAIELEPGDAEPYYEMGKIYHAKSEFDEKYVRKAISFYEKYIYLGGKKEKEVKELIKSLRY